MSKKTDLKLCIENEEANLASLRKELDRYSKLLTNSVKRLEKLKKEFYKDHFDDMEWLLKNPTIPGQYEALRAKAKAEFGEYRGVMFQGHSVNKDGKIIQQGVEFSIYSDTDETLAMCAANIKKFIDQYIQYLVPFYEIKSRWNDKIPPVTVIPFSYNNGSSYYSSYVAFDPVEKAWYEFDNSMGRGNANKKFKDEAAMIAYVIKRAKKAANGDDE